MFQPDHLGSVILAKPSPAALMTPQLGSLHITPPEISLTIVPAIIRPPLLFSSCRQHLSWIMAGFFDLQGCFCLITFRFFFPPHRSVETPGPFLKRQFRCNPGQRPPQRELSKLETTALSGMSDQNRTTRLALFRSVCRI